MTMWLTLLAVGAGSYLLRVAPMLIDGRLSPRLDRRLARAGTAALTGLATCDISATLLAPGRTWAEAAAALAAVGVGGTIAHRGGSLLRVVAIGLAVYLGLSTALLR